MRKASRKARPECGIWYKKAGAAWVMQCAPLEIVNVQVGSPGICLVCTLTAECVTKFCIST